MREKKTGKGCLEGQHLENTRIQTLRKMGVWKVSEISEQYHSSVDQHLGST